MNIIGQLTQIHINGTMVIGIIFILAGIMLLIVGAIYHQNKVKKVYEQISTEYGTDRN